MAPPWRRCLYDRQVRETLERELKLEPSHDFAMPELPGRPLEPRFFSSTYYDTRAHSLARCGITLRCRVENEVPRWQLKLPRGAARAELEVPDGAEAVPEEITALLVAHKRYGPLEPVAVLETHRVGIRVTSGQRSLADVLLDSVAARRHDHAEETFEEIEVELIGGDEDDLARLSRVLRRAGAQETKGTPKLMRVLALDDEEVPSKAAPSLEHLRFLLGRQLRELETFDPGVRLGDDAEDLHRFRVATRRSRALIRASRSLAGSHFEPLREELRWLGGALGPARDLDVLLEHLRDVVSGLDADASGGEAILAQLDRERGEDRVVVLQALGSRRYLALLDRFSADLESLREPVSAIRLVDIARAEAERLFRAYAKLGPSPADERLHALRIKAKHLRYAAELAAQAEGKRWLAVVGATRDLQDLIGSHQDAVVAEKRVRALAVDGTSLAAGRIVELERRRRREARAQVPAVWDRVVRAVARAS
jgi:CHAD domain-containing protein